MKYRQSLVAVVASILLLALAALAEEPAGGRSVRATVEGLVCQF
ncbi:MAG: hypothetical protein ACREQ9_04045 [Candidatus Binatia bacterium]